LNELGSGEKESCEYRELLVAAGYDWRGSSEEREISDEWPGVCE